MRESVSPTPLSPLVVPPPRRRSNLNGTPSKLDSSFANMENHGGKQYVLDGSPKATTNEHAMVISLLKSAFNVFSEWLALGGSGVEEITKNINEWKHIFQSNVNGIDARSELFPSYCRLGAIVANQFSNYEILKDAMTSTVNFVGDSGADDCIKSTVAYLVSAKSTNAVKTTELVTLSLELLEEDENNSEDMETFNGFIEHQISSVQAVLQAIMSTSNGVVSFADAVSKRLATIGANSTASFYENVLVLLCKEYPHGRISKQLKDCILLHISADSIESNREFKEIRQTLEEIY